MKSDWTEKIREKLSESTATPPDSLWTAISSELDTVISTKSRHPRVRTWRWVAAAACLLAVMVCGVHILISERAVDGVTVENLADNRNNAITADARPSATHVDKPTGPIAPIQHSYVKSQTQRHCTPNAVVSQINEAGQSGKVPQDILTLSLQPSDSKATDVAADSLHTAPMTDPSTNATLAADHIQQPADYSTGNNHGQKPRKIFSVSLYASNTNMPILGSFMNGINQGDHVCYEPPYGSMDNSSDELQNPEPMGCELIDVKHSQPIRFGVSVRLPLSSTLSIATGVVYSRLTSTLTWGNSEVSSFESKQTLNYIGVPVAIDYNLSSYKAAGFYLTGGTMAEKCIQGETHLTHSPAKERVSEKVLQASLFLGAGAEIKLNRHFCIYAEPLATFYIDNHSGVTNIYKDRPFNFDLRIGVRYTIK